MRTSIFYIVSILLIIESSQLDADDKVFINQQGYLPGAAKFVFVAQPAESFEVVDFLSNQIIANGKLQLWRANDPATGLTIYKGEFSQLTATGQYFIDIPGVGKSFKFLISDSVYLAVYQKSLKGFYLQRCGVELTTDHSGVYSHPRCHSTDGVFHSTSGLSGFHDTIGGWHDAGDYGKYTVNAGVAVGTLLMAYELFPRRFNQDNLNIPESGNGVPDILDEARYELEWLLKMQDQNGGVYHKLTREQFSGFIMPQRDTAVRYIYQISSTATADFAAITARASRNYQPFDSLFSQQCLAAAENAWQYLEKHPHIVPVGGFQNPPGTNTGEYGDGQDSDERLWAAAELFLSTGIEKYHNYFKSNYNSQSLINAPMGWQDVKTMALLAYITGKRADLNPTIHSQIQSSLITYCQTLVNKKNQSGFQVLLEPGEYFWGCNSHTLNKAILMIIAYEKTKNQDFFSIALDQLHYILGVNAHGLSFITGIGDKSVRNPHHRPSGADNVADPVPGLLAGGPNQNLQDPVLQAHFNSSTPPALCYIDHIDSYASNEIAINWNAPLVFVAGYFADLSSSTNVKPSDATLPQKIQLMQNYPNPFAQTTTIAFHSEIPQNVQLNIYDLLGRIVIRATLPASQKSTNRFEWDGKDHSGKMVSAGLYFYQIECAEQSETKKLIYLNRTQRNE